MPRAAGRGLCKTYGGKITAGRDPKNAGRGRRYFLKFSRAADHGTGNAGRIARRMIRGRRNAGGGPSIGAPEYRVKNRGKPPKIRKSRNAATGSGCAGKGHVFHK